MKSLSWNVGHQYQIHNDNSVTKLETKEAINTTKKKEGLEEGEKEAKGKKLQSLWVPLQTEIFIKV